jgi:hypothetical protein
MNSCPQLNPKPDRQQSSSEGVQVAPLLSFDHLDPPKQAPVAPMFEAADAPGDDADHLQLQSSAPDAGFGWRISFRDGGTFMKGPRPRQPGPPSPST